jgi:drug/metabolite transporter (DMT)-like permease
VTAPLSRARTLALTALAMTAFAGNSLLCRQALAHTRIDPATFTTVRLVSGALVLALLALARGGRPARAGNWASAVALFVYAAGFSFAYVTLPASVGALLLFGAVQATMIGRGLAAGERLTAPQAAGVALALAGLVGLLLPGLSAPPAAGAALMLAAGVAWGVYSLRGRGASDPAAVTAGNFLRAAPLALATSLVLARSARWDAPGLLLAVVSGALASGAGYVIWYAALPGLTAASAAAVQLSVPVLAALGAIAFLGERPSARLAAASVAILGGIALVIGRRRRSG